MRTPPDSGNSAEAGSAHAIIQVAGSVFGDVSADRPAGPAADQVAGWPIAELTDPFALEVHRSIHVAGRPDDGPLPLLPSYIEREHDRRLAATVRNAAGGDSGIAVLVGGSSTGKTRACWEAVHRLPEDWRLWHPVGLVGADGVGAVLSGIGPRTVIWLNEAQLYLTGRRGEETAAGLRALLQDPGRRPVLILATLWPEYWDLLTSRPDGAEADAHAQARELLTGNNVSVPVSFEEVAGLEDLAAADPRLSEAVERASGGRITQYLAGVPALLDRFGNAPPAAKAVIHAAMDARRLGCGPELPRGLLLAAAPGYLSDDEWDAIGDEWFEQALVYTAKPCTGVPGPLTRIRRRNQAAADAEPRYRLADYLDQVGRRDRQGRPPPASFWEGAGHADGTDLPRLADEAHRLGLFRVATRLRKLAVLAGDDANVAYSLIQYRPRHGGELAVLWAVQHARLDDSHAVADLLRKLRDSDGPLAALLDRDPVGHADVENTYAVARLLDALHEVGAAGQITALLARDPAARATLADPYVVGALLHSLRRLSLDGVGGADRQVETLLARDPARSVEADSPRGVAVLLRALSDVDARPQVRELAVRAVREVDASDTGPVIELLNALDEVDERVELTGLALRTARRIDLARTAEVARLLEALRATRADEAVAALLARDPAGGASLEFPSTLARLLTALAAAGAAGQIETLLTRDLTASLDGEGPAGTVALLRALHDVGAVTRAVADRLALAVPLDEPDTVAEILHGLLDVGATAQVSAFLDRDPAGQVALVDPVSVARILKALREAGAAGQLAGLLARDPAGGVALEDPLEAARKLAFPKDWVWFEQDPLVRASFHQPGHMVLLEQLRLCGAREQAARLEARALAAGLPVREPAGQAPELGPGVEPDGTAARPWAWDDIS